MLLVAVAGASCSGKSTLTNSISSLLNLPLIHQDGFYKPDKDIPKRNGIAHWDCPEAIDFDSFKLYLDNVKSEKELVCSKLGPNRPVAVGRASLKNQEIDDLVLILKELTANQRVAVVDGFLLFCDSGVIEKLDIHIFLHASLDTLDNRRMSRASYITSSGNHFLLEGNWTDPPDYFKKVVYPSYLEHNSKILGCIDSGVESNQIIIDSENNSRQDVVVLALRHIIEVLRTKIK